MDYSIAEDINKDLDLPDVDYFSEESDEFSQIMDIQLEQAIDNPCMSSNVVEVTDKGGAVGFVAVGRVLTPRHQSLNSPSPEILSYSYNTTPAIGQVNQINPHRSKSEQRYKTSDSESLSKIASTNSLKNDKLKKSAEKLKTSHSRHNSEPYLNDYELLSKAHTSSANNESDLAMTPTNIQIKSRTNASVKDKQKPKSKDKKSEKNAGSNSHKRSRRTSTEENKPAEMEVQPQQEAVAENFAGKANKLCHKPSNINASPLCKQCGQRHRLNENHEYDYVEDIDDDLQCDICLQPFVDPYDTKCGHTYCALCLKNYVQLKKMCPIDRKELSLNSTDCWQSSLVMRKLVNKLSVYCPNVDLCKLQFPRSDIEGHLKERCPGTVLKCSKSMFGCSYKGPRMKQAEHNRLCKFQHMDGNAIESLYPDCTKHSVEIFRPEGVAELGIAVVGGSDTPLRNVVVQNILPRSLVAEDGRVCRGDIIIEVNGEDFHCITHVEARAVLAQSAHLMRFTLLREKSPSPTDFTPARDEQVYSERVAVCLLKPPSEQLGIKITTCEDGRAGIFILELVEGKVAHASNELQVGDRILEIAHTDLFDGTPEIAARVIQNSGERVDIVVSRQIIKPVDTIKNPYATDRTIPRNKQQNNATSNTQNNTARFPPQKTLPQQMKTSFKEKVISVSKAAQESLGIVVAGGASGARGDLPVFVQDVQPLGVLGRDKRLKRGDLLVEVNGVHLTGLSHVQAISVLKDAAQHCKEVVLVAVELNYAGKDEDFALWEELSGVLHERGRKRGSGGSSWASWTPSWRMWLAVPPPCRIVHEVAIRRTQQCGLGFSIVGGKIGFDLSSLVFVKYIVPGGPADLQAGLKCGDEIVAINGRDASMMSHSSVVQALKCAPTPVVLTIMSWPGSLH